MALTPGKPAGSYYEWKTVADDKAVVVFKIREIMETRDIVDRQTGDKSTVYPTRVDAVVLTESQAKTVIRNEEVIGSGFRSLRRYEVGADVPCVMGWKQGRVMYVVADPQPADSDAFKLAAEVFQKTDGDPYSAAERAANPTATLTAAAPAPAQPPAASEPAPWQAPAVGGPSGPQWSEQAPAAAQPVTASAVW